jgi:hypothetical protein
VLPRGVLGVVGKLHIESQPQVVAARRDFPQHLAGLFRGGMVPQAYVYPAAMRATRDGLRRRMQRLRTRRAPGTCTDDSSPIYPPRS